MTVSAGPALDLADTAVCAPACCPPEGLSEPEAERLAALLKALADPVRLRLYSRIAATAGELCVCDTGDLGVSQPTVSHHLRKLREAGLIEGERRGTWVFYRAVPGTLQPVEHLTHWATTDAG